MWTAKSFDPPGVLPGQRHLAGPAWRRHLHHVLIGLLATAAFTPAVIAIYDVLDVNDVSIVYLIPVVLTANRYGMTSAISAAISGTATAAFFIYSPIYSLRVINPQDVIALSIFITVAAITSHLSSVARTSAAMVAHRSRELESLYAFSRKLAAANAPERIYEAIEEHASAIVGGSVRIVRLAPGNSGHPTVPDDVPPAVRSALGELDLAGEPATSRVVADTGHGAFWLLRPFPQTLRSAGLFLIELGPVDHHELESAQRRVDELLSDAVTTLERLDVATTVAEAELRRRSASLREAIIGSASHGLRTPLASIMGSASILAAAPAVASDPRLASLAGIVVSEAERLNGDIQKMLDAAMLSASGAEPVPVLIEVSDLIDAAIEAKRNELAGHEIARNLDNELPFVRADPHLAREALGLLLDNAARYSAPGSAISVEARSDGDMIAIAIDDEGVGIEDAEKSRLFEKFYRGSRVRDTTRGSGLGLWIATAFVDACKGRIAIAGRGDRPGTRVTVRLPAASEDEMRLPGGHDD